MLRRELNCYRNLHRNTNFSEVNKTQMFQQKKPTILMIISMAFQNN